MVAPPRPGYPSLLSYASELGGPSLAREGIRPPPLAPGCTETSFRHGMPGDGANLAGNVPAHGGRLHASKGPATPTRHGFHILRET